MTTTTVGNASSIENLEVSAEPVDPSAPGAASRLVDADIPWWAGSPLANVMEFNDIEALASNSRVVVVARLTDTMTDVRVLGMAAPEAQESSGPAIHFDGVVFEVEHVLKGDIEAGEEVIVGVPAVATQDGKVLGRVRTPYPALLEDGLRDVAAEHRYVVFANLRDEVPVYDFATPAGVATIDSANAVSAASGPLASGGWTIDSLSRQFG